MKNIFFILCIILISIGAYAQIVPNVPGNPAPAPTSVNYGAGGLSNYNNATTTLRNYTRISVPQQPYTSTSSIVPSSLFWQGIVATSYIDGLGRPLQNVERFGVNGASTTDVVQVHVYDEFGRVTYDYLPYTKSAASDGGKMKTTPYSDLSGLYGSIYPGQEPFSKKIYDNTPLNRVVQAMAPGKNWVGNNHGVTINYDVNDNVTTFVSTGQVDYNILNYNIAHNGIDDLPVVNGYYDVGELYVNKTRDEDGNYTLRYSNKAGQTLAVMNYIQSPENHNFKYLHITYYVYDDFERLRFVISPEALEAYSPSAYNYGIIDTDIANKLCYKYWYNEKGLLTQKKLPGRDVEYYVYDNRNRMVLNQDGNLRANGNQWMFTIYDGLNRVVMSGLSTASTSLSYWENMFVNDVYTNYTNTALNYFLLKYDLYHEYDSNNLLNAIVYTRGFYDDYSNAALSGFSYNTTDINDLAGASPFAQPTIKGSLLRGLETGTQVRIMNNNNPAQWITTVNYYDDKGQLIQQQTNEAKGTTRVTNQYDFAGSTISTVIKHFDQHTIPGPLGGNITYADSVEIIKKVTKNYNTGAVTKLEQNINNTGWRTIFQNTYDQLGRLSNKSQNAADNIYTYNIRNWLTGINATDIDANPVNKFFFEQLSYDHGFHDTLLNGNISGIIWKNAGAAARKRMYGYTYDNVSRLKHAEFGQYDATVAPASPWSKTSVDFTVSNLTYDDNGNIMSMSQRGPDANATPNPGNMDILHYTYATNSNQLMAVQDSGLVSTSAPDFKDGNTSGNDYAYDPNGNLTQDKNKGISSISYTKFNKPEHIVVTGKGTIDYLYDAMGNKLKRTVYDLATNQTKVTDYVDPLVYQDGNLQYILHEEGRCRPMDSTTPAGSYLYDYFVKDHLGNVRTTINAEASSMGPYLYHTGLEISLANTEAMDWNHLDAGRNIKPDGSTGDVMAAEMNASVPDQMIGPAIMLRVMPGDQFAISAETYFDAVGTSNQNNDGDLMNAVLGALTAGTNYGNVPVTELDDNLQILQNTIGNPANVGRFGTVLGYVPVDSNAPQSYVAYLFFDNNNELVKDKSVIIPFGSVASQWNTIGTASNLTVDEPGYISVFAFTKTNSATHIDHFSVDYYKGNVLEQEDHYYPFGLTLTNPAYGPNEKNNYKYNGKELQHNEFTGNVGLNWYDYDARMYDPQTGRWTTPDPLGEFARRQSPYNYAINNPVRFIDPTGMTPVDGGALNEVVIVAKRKHKSGLATVGSFLWGAVDYVPFAGSIKQIGTGIYHGNVQEIAMGAVFLAIDLGSGGEGSVALRLAEKSAQVIAEDALKIAAEDAMRVSAEDVVKVAAEDEIREGAEKSLDNIIEKFDEHHSDPEFLGGEHNQGTTTVERGEHKQLHKDLNKHLDNYKNANGDKFKNGNLKTMKPGKGNNRMRIQANFTRQQRLQAMADFYKGSGAKYGDAAKDFFIQHRTFK